MKLSVGVLLTILSLSVADRDLSHVFPNHLPNPAIRIPRGLPSPRITGGTEAPPHSLPYQAALFIPRNEGLSFCGGSLISTRFVLTAAHCVDVITGPVEVVLGAHRINEGESTQVVLMSSTVFVHPAWSTQLLRNDVALVQLPQDVQLNENIQLIALPPNNANTYEGQNALVSGWGLDSDQSTAISPVLREVTIPIISNSICGLLYFGIIQDTHICASGSGGKSTCSGDSGGPLVINGVQVGIVSFGLALGCEIGFPPAFTRVSSFLDYIYGIIR